MRRSTRRRREVGAYLLGAASLFAAELVVVAAVLAPPPTTAVAGTAQPVPAPAVADNRPRSVPAAPTKPVRPARPVKPPATPSPKAEPKPAKAPEPERAEPQGRRPNTIRLPGGGTADLVREEVGPDAVLPVPADLDEATWWGARLDAPSGASVFAGHVNWNGRRGPFAELWDVGVGERVTVVDAAGKAWHYRVSRIITLGKNELPGRADTLFGQGGQHRIVLVTCGGRWLGGTTGYAENRVVVAEPS